MHLCLEIYHVTCKVVYATKNTVTSKCEVLQQEYSYIKM